MNQGAPPTVLVTGGERGIGLGIVRHLANRAYRVIVAGVDDEAATQNLTSLGSQVEYIHTDVGDEGAVKACFEALDSSSVCLHGIVSNAALAQGTHCPVTQMEFSTWKRVIDVNLTGAFLVSKYGIPRMAKLGGSIVFISSIRSFQTDPFGEAYAASKGGLVAFARALALSEGPRIRANCISPGWIHTGSAGDLSEADHAIHPVGRVGREEDVARLTGFLLSADSEYITGQNHIIDGGISLMLPYQD